MEELQDLITFLKNKGLTDVKLPIDVWVGIIEYFAYKQEKQCAINGVVRTNLTDKHPIEGANETMQTETDHKEKQLFCRDCKYNKAKSYGDQMYYRDCRQMDRFTAK